MTKSSISSEKIDHVAKLARLRLSEKEKKTYTKQISEILFYMDRLNRVDTKNTPPSFQVTLDPLSASALRPDQPKNCLSQKAALSGAPSITKNYIVAPQAIKK